MKKPITYQDSGVDIQAGNALVERIKPATRRTLRPEVLTGLGGFGGLCEIPPQYQHPVLVSGTDGVGTKLKLALDSNRLEGIGIDLVAMCVNDVLVTGAEPLFFLDYYACGQLDLDRAQTVIESIATGCEQAGCALIGGETAEMPGLYQDEDFDLAGFCVGVAEKSQLITQKSPEAGDVLLGLPSSGPHANGFSLIRKVLEERVANPMAFLEDKPIIEHLMAPTTIYVKPVLSLLKAIDVRAIAHITGGGITENLPRVLPPDLYALIDENAWNWPPIFKWLQEQSGNDNQEMYRTFNCGIGLILVVPPEAVQTAYDMLDTFAIQPIELGQLKSASHQAQHPQQQVAYSSELEND